MGIVGLARWKNAPPNGLDSVMENIALNHTGTFKGKWQLLVRSYRSSTHPTRTILSVISNDFSYALLEDNAILSSTERPSGHGRITFVTLSPVNSLEPLLNQIGVKWALARTSGTGHGSVVQIEGLEWTIGTDWIVRVGKVIQIGGGVRGMVIEAEYLPIPSSAPTSGGTLNLVKELLNSIIPSVPAGEIMAVDLPQGITWADVLDEEQEPPEESDSMDEDELYFDEDIEKSGTNDSEGRERRSAFLIARCLQTEGIL